MKYCTACGAENKDKARFCLRCREKFDDDTIPPREELEDPLASLDDDIATDLDGRKTVVDQSPGAMVLGNRYKLVRELGRGAMGIVHLAHDEQLDIDVAVKILPDELGRSRRAVERLKNEAVAAMRLQHHNIMRMINFEQTPEAAFLVMEYIEGTTVEDMLESSDAMDEDAFLPIADAVCRAIHYAHEQKVVHGDLKPANIMVTRADGVAKVTDFGISYVIKETMTGKTKVGASGTLLYMAPEVIEGSRGTPASDQYALACSFYEMVSGEPVFSRGDVAYQHVHKDPEPVPGIAEHVTDALMTALSKDPEARFASVELFRQSLMNESAGAGSEVEQEEEGWTGEEPDDFEDSAAPPGGGVIGIDYGTDAIRAAVVVDGRPIVLVNDDEDPNYPSLVVFPSDGSIEFGHDAQAAAEEEPWRALRNLKRILGRSSEELSESELEQLPFPVVETEQGRVGIGVDETEFSPVILVSQVFSFIRRKAEMYLGEGVSKAVLSVPAGFSDRQLQAVRDAATIGGLEVVRVTTDTAAFGLAHGFYSRGDAGFAAVSFGAGNSEASLIETTPDGDTMIVEVLSASGDATAGAADIDVGLAEMLREQVESELSLADAVPIAASMRQELIENDESSMTIVTDDGQSHDVVLDRDDLEVAAEDVMSQLSEVCSQVLADRQTDGVDLSSVMVVGRAAADPMVQETIANSMGISTDLFDLSPQDDGMIAAGAALLAAVVTGQRQDMLLIEVVPQNLGIEVAGGQMSVIVERGSALPVMQSDIFTTSRDDQDTIELRILQGDYEEAEHDTLLAVCEMTGIPPMPQGSAEVEVTFHVELSRMLRVTARETTSGRDLAVSLERPGALSEEELAYMKKAARALD